MTTRWSLLVFSFEQTSAAPVGMSQRCQEPTLTVNAQIYVWLLPSLQAYFARIVSALLCNQQATLE
jgi:hypothetical protein